MRATEDTTVTMPNNIGKTTTLQTVTEYAEANADAGPRPMNRRDRRAAKSNAKRREVCGAIIRERILEDGTIEQLHATRGYRRYRAV